VRALNGNGSESPAKSKGGRKRTKDTAEVYKACYHMYTTGTGTRDQQLIRLQPKILEIRENSEEPDEVPGVPDVNTMRLYAKRHAKRFNLPI
jgi:hypothetical protein